MRPLSIREAPGRGEGGTGALPPALPEELAAETLVGRPWCGSYLAII